MKTYIKNFFHVYKIKNIILFLIGLIPIIIYNSVNNYWSSLFGYCNGFFISAGSLICIGLLSFCSGQGAFDIFSYLVRRKKLESGAHEDLYQYSTRKKEERSLHSDSFVPYLFIGAIYLIIAVILNVIYAVR